MQYHRLGNTDILVSELCFGTLTMGPLQRNLSVKDGAELLELAFSRGVNFLDTAEIYGTYPYVKQALRSKPDAVVCTKSYSYDTATAQASFAKAVQGIGREYIDIYLLHEQESIHTIRGHWEAIEFLLRKKEQGYIGAVGLSTHYVACVEAACRYPELEILFPLINYTGVGIADGTREDMMRAVKKAKAAGKGLFAMKPLGGGHLIGEREKALSFIRSQREFDSVAIGMQTKAEVLLNCALFSDEPIPEELQRQVAAQPRKLLIQDWCEGCGACVNRCKNHAMQLENGRAVVRQEQCALCGDCASACPQFCIKVI